MEESENLQKLKDILATFADLIREAEGNNNPVLVADMRQKMAEIDLATFNINNGVVNGHTVVNGTSDPTTPADTLDYYRKLLTNFANKVRVGSEKLDIDDIETQENLVCGVHMDSSSRYGLRLPENVTGIGNKAFYECYDLKQLICPSNLTSIGDSVFYGCQLSINFPENLTTIGTAAFN